MKKIILILVVTLLILGTFLNLRPTEGASIGTKRKVLLELFTATWCGPCAKYGPYVDQTFDIYGQDKIILVRNQVWGDGLDTEETNNRCNFYGVNGVPTLYINGKFDYHPANYSEYRKKIDDILKTTSPISINIDPIITEGKNLGVINLKIEVLDNISLKEPHLIVALYEKIVNYEGINKEKTHKFVIRDYIYDEVGSLLNLKKGDILTFQFPLNLKQNINPNDFGIAVWVQDFENLEVIQVESNNIKIISNPTPPIVISPKDNQIYIEKPIFKFLTNFKQIRFQISDNKSFSNIILDQIIDKLEFKFESLKESTKYYLRAKSIDGGKESDWSEIIAFSYNPNEKIYSFVDVNYNLFGGSLTSIVQDPKNPNILYLGSYGGGVYKSIDRGKNWFKSSFGLESLYINSLDIDKNNTDNLIAGTLGGVYISFDGGNSWINYGLSNIKKVLLSSDSKIIYALTYYNLYRSLDYGKNWIDITPKFGETSYALITMNVDPFNSSKIFLSYYSWSESLASLYYSENKGESWSKSFLPILYKYTIIRDIKFDPSNKFIVYLAARIGDGILFSEDGGKTFKKSSFSISFSDSIFNIEINQINNSIIYISTFNSLYKTIDKGLTWKMIYNGDQINQILLDKTELDNIYMLTYGGDGILKSTDGGFNWLILNNGIKSNKIFSIITNNNISIQTSSGFYSLNDNEWKNKTKKFPNYYDNPFFYVDYKGKLIQNPLNKNELFWFYYYYGNIIVYSNDNGSSWLLINKPYFEGHFYDLDIDFINKKLYVIFYDYNLNRYLIYRGDFKGVWEKIDYNGITDFYEPILRIDNKNPQVLYIGMQIYWDRDSSGKWIIKGGGLYKSTDSGKTWKLISFKEESVYKLFIDPKDSKKIYANTSFGFKRSVDGGLTWKILFKENVDTMSFHPKLPVIYANRGRNLIKSEDDGLTWKYITWDYSIDPVKISRIISLAIDENDPNTVYIGTDGSGIYKFGVLEKEKKFIPPSPPTLSLNYQDNSIKLSWTKPEDGSYPINGYSLYKKIDNGEFNLLRNFDKDTLEYIDTDIKPGKTYSYYIQSFDSQNNFSEKSNIVTFNIPLKDTTPPILEITSPPSDNFITNNQSLTISGNTIDNESGIQKLLINNNEVNLTLEGNFNYNVNLIEGENNFIIISIDKENNETRKNIRVVCDLSPPKINLSLPNETSEPTLLIYGSISDNISGVKYLKINNKNISISPDNKFSYTLNLSEGINNILIESEDNAGNKISKNYSIRYTKRIIIKLQIGNQIMVVNDKEQLIDVPPQIIEGRTYLPIRWIAEPLGAQVNWDSDEKKVTILFNEIKIELWIGKNIARVNGNYKLIDPDNPKVVPLIISGRTMLPVRFVAENLGCKVEWNPIYQSITITYPGD